MAAPFFLLAAALPSLRESPDAAVVNVSSSVGSIVKPGNMLYGSSKAALEYLTRAWAYELAADRIRVNCVAPGPVDTPIHATYADVLDATYADLARRIPLRRMGHVDDIAAWIWLLVAPESAWTTGNVIHVMAGRCSACPSPPVGSCSRPEPLGNLDDVVGAAPPGVEHRPRAVGSLRPPASRSTINPMGRQWPITPLLVRRRSGRDAVRSWEHPS